MRTAGLSGAVLLCLVTFSVAPAQTATTSAPASPLLVDFLSPATYDAPLPPVEPTGFFAIGRRYMHPPRVEWKPVAGAARYQILLLQGSRIVGTSEATAPPQVARQGWEQIQPGKGGIAIQAIDASGKRLALSSLVPFYRAGGFDAAVVSPRKEPYRDAAVRAFDALANFKLPGTTSVPTSGPSSSILPVLLTASSNGAGCAPYSLPVLHDWAHVDMLEGLLQSADEPLKARILAYARSVGDHLLLARVPAEGHLYGNMIRSCIDFHGNPALPHPVADEAIREKMLRLVEPAQCGRAGETLVKVFALTGDARYLDAAYAMAETHVKTQLPDGSWPGRVDGKTGEVFGGYSSATGTVASFLNHLATRRPDPRWGPAEQRAREWMLKHPMQTYGWVSSDEHGVRTATMENPLAGGLSNRDLFAFVRYLCRVHASVPKVVDLIAEQLAWNDSQFVFYGPDPELPFDPFYPTCAGRNTPAGAEDGWAPTDFDTASWAKSLLDVHRLTKDPRWLAIARSAADALENYQLADGRTVTWLPDRTFGISPHAGPTAFRPAGWAMSAALWAELAALKQ